MNAPHWHLAINHLPVMGVFLVMLLLGYALVRGRGELYGVGLGALVLLALATVPVFFTGRSADVAVMEIQEIDDKLIHVHEAAANLAFIGIGVVGVASLIILWFGRRLPHASRGAVMLVFALAVVETVLMARAANLGGNIRHPEIREGQTAAETSPAKAEP